MSLMADRDDSDQPRKRIAVACGRCRKRKIRCSGDPGNGGPCQNCKNAGYEPCLFLRVSSQETQLKDGSDYGYNLDAARPYAHSRATVSHMGSLSPYAPEMPTGDVLYRQTAYPYGSKSYYPAVSGWANTYADDGGVDYGLNYTYPMMNQDSAPLVPGYGQYSTRKSSYVDPEPSSYSYGNLVHRPATSSDSQNFSLSSMATALPSASERIVSSDRLHSHVNRTLTSSSSYRSDGQPAPYPSSKGSSGSSTNTMPDVGYTGLQSSFESPYSAPNTLPSTLAHRSTSHTDASYSTGTSSATDTMYSASDHSLRSTEDGSSGYSYIYSDSKLDSARRESHSSGGASGGSILPNGHVYVPDGHSSHVHSHSYVVPSASSSQGGGINGSTAAIGTSGTGGSGSGRGSGSSHGPSDSHRRSAGSLRGG
ncbi:hypothetical protein F5Y18DRAFT_434198 [Xylariaceae sp. FL1019]|nr:hypothetical protein F5Y18DRAFT_434198 [Xylariaceae sp. FL1019]